MRSLTLAAIDIGSGSVKGVLGVKDLTTREIEVLAVAQRACLGVRNGEVINPEQVGLCLTEIKNELAKAGETKIKEACFNIGGTHLFSVNSQGLVSVARADKTIVKEDVQRVLKEAEAVNLPSNKQVWEVFPKDFIVDGEGDIKEPVGLKGIRLEAKVLLSCVFSPILNNLEKAIALSGLNYSDIFITPLAVSKAVLSQEQKELGVAVLDIGFSVSSLAVFDKGELVDFAVFPLGASHITNDLAIGLRSEIQTAENIKQEFGTLKPIIKRVAGDKIKFTEGDIECSRLFLRNVIESRVSEIFFEVQKALKKIMGLRQLPGGLVLTGGGSSMPGLVDFAKQKCKLPCRLAEIKIKGLEDSKFATAAGLLALGFEGLEFGGGESGSGSFRFGKKIKRIFKTFLP